jgi:hypothetical protein
MVDLDSNPTKLIEVVETGRQLLMTRGSLTTFSVANDVSKCFAIILVMFASTYPILGKLNIMRLNPASAGAWRCVSTPRRLRAPLKRDDDAAAIPPRQVPARSAMRAQAPANR